MTSTRFRAATLAVATFSLGALALVPTSTASATAPANNYGNNDAVISPTDASYTSVGVSCNQTCQEPVPAPGHSPIDFP